MLSGPYLTKYKSKHNYGKGHSMSRQKARGTFHCAVFQKGLTPEQSKLRWFTRLSLLRWSARFELMLTFIFISGGPSSSQLLSCALAPVISVPFWASRSVVTDKQHKRLWNSRLLNLDKALFLLLTHQMGKSFCLVEPRWNVVWNFTYVHMITLSNKAHILSFSTSLCANFSEGLLCLVSLRLISKVRRLS